MRTFSHDEFWLDRLVDGEWSDDQLPELLARLERDPDAWRRCAMAFLEAQALNRDLGFIRSSSALQQHANRLNGHTQSSLLDRSAEPAEAQSVSGQPVEGEAPVAAPGQVPAIQPADVRPRTLHAWFLRNSTTWMAMAACFLVAFILGLEVRQQLMPARGSNAVNSIADHSVESASHTTFADRPRKNRGAPHAGSSERLWGNVKFVSNGDLADGENLRGSHEAQVPLVEKSSLEDDWLEKLPAAVPAEVERALRRAGYSVRQKRGLVPLDLEGNRRVVVPVDQVEIVPVEGRDIQ